MPYDGSGNFTPVAAPAFPAIAGQVITAAYFNQTILDMTSNGLTNALTRDGQGRPTANINWNAKNLTNVNVLEIVSGLLNGGTIWAASNDGPGSGLDADLLDGQQGVYYLAAASYTAADVLAKLLTVDGPGSGLDADTVDGIQGAAIALLASANFTILQVGAKSVGYLELPQDAQSAAYQLVAGDAGGHVYYTGGAAALTIPANATVGFPIGTAITLVNNGSGVLTVTRAGSVVLIWAGVGTDANRALAVGGLATILKVGTNTWFISGAGLS